MVCDVGLRQPHEEGAAPRSLTVAGFALRRVLATIPIVFVVVTLLFFLMRSIGGDPFRHGPLVGMGSPAWAKYNDPKPASIQSNLERRYGLDLPWYEQYGNYLQGLVTFDFGHSLTWRDRSVTEIIGEQAPRSFQLGLLAFAWTLALGLPAGLAAALRAGSRLDDVVRLASSLAIAVPNFLVATLLIYVGSVKLGLLPTSGWYDWRHMLLPSLTLALLPAAFLARLVRAAMLETLREDYVRSARAKGLRRRGVIARHVLRNSLIPALSAGGPLLAHLLTGSFVIEHLFGIPGIGRYYVTSVLARDYPLVLAVTVLLAVFVILANLVVDLLHGALDPRVREAR